MGLIDRMAAFLAAEPRAQRTMLEQRASAGSAVLRDVLPGSSRNDVLDGCRCNVESPRYVGTLHSAGVKSSNLHNLRFGEQCVPVFRSGAGRGRPSLLLVHVGNIIGLSANEQMSRVAATRVVTSVAQDLIGCEWSVRKLPCNAVRAGLAAIAPGELTIPLAIKTRRPQPTCILATGRIDLLPESVSFRAGAKCIAQVLAGNRAVLLASGKGREGTDNSAADNAGYFNIRNEGILRVHLDRLLHRLIWGAVPAGVGSTASAFACLHYTKFRAVTGNLGGNA